MRKSDMRRHGEAITERQSQRQSTQACMEKSLIECDSRKRAIVLASCTGIGFCELSAIVRGVSQLDKAIGGRPIAN